MRAATDVLRNEVGCEGCSWGRGVCADTHGNSRYVALSRIVCRHLRWKIGCSWIGGVGDEGRGNS